MGTDVVYEEAEEPGTAVSIPQLSFVMPESWPATATGPAAAPAIAYRLRQTGPDLYGTATASFALVTDGPPEQCNYNWTVSATPLVGL